MSGNIPGLGIGGVGGGGGVSTPLTQQSPAQVAKSLVPGQQPTLSNPTPTNLPNPPNNPNTQTAAANTQLAANVTAGTTHQEKSTFSGMIRDASTVNLNKCLEDSKNLEVRRKDFNNKMKEIDNNSISPLEQEKLETFEQMSMFDEASQIAKLKISNQISGLTQYIFEEPGGAARFNTIELTTLFCKLHDLGAFDEMIRLHENANDPNFIDSLLHNELLASAYLNCTDAKPDVVIMLTTKFMEKDGNNPELLTFRAKAYEMKYKATVLQNSKFSFLSQFLTCM